MALPKTTPDPLIHENVTIFVDLERRMISFTYRGHLTVAVITKVYGWVVNSMITWFDPDDMRGSVFDFREVTSFELGNIPIASRANEDAGRLGDLRLYPVAHLVNSFEKEVKVRTYMEIIEGSRQHIAKSPHDALACINAWNKKHNRVFGLSDELLHSWPQMHNSN